MIEYVYGDITAVDNGMLLHGVNCSGVMGSGVALAIKNKWSGVYTDFKSRDIGEAMLGKFYPVKVERNLYVGNCYTQLKYGKDGKVYASLNAIAKSVLSAYKFAELNNITTIAMPKIGCGLGGLNWGDVSDIINTINKQYPTIATKVYYI